MDNFLSASLRDQHLGDVEFPLLMLSAMFENGGNLTQRFFDGHPQMFVYPFESQLGTEFVKDHLTPIFPAKYRWPTFSGSANPIDDYNCIIDQECRDRVANPQASKFRDVDFDLIDDERRRFFIKHTTASGRSRGAIVAAFFHATFDAWRNYRQTGEERCYVGFSPIIVVDGDKILQELPAAHLLHIVRNPYSAYADTKKRAAPLTLDQYMDRWSLAQYYALRFRAQFPDRLHILRLEDILTDPVGTLGPVCQKLGLRISEILAHPTWNGSNLDVIYPWGIISSADPDANRAAAEELSQEEHEAVRLWSAPYLEAFNYEGF